MQTEEETMIGRPLPGPANVRVKRGSTARTSALCDDAVNRAYLPFIEQAHLYSSFTPTEGAGPMMSAAEVFAYVHPRLTPVILDGELIVGGFIRATEGQGYHWYPDGYSWYVDGFAANVQPDRPDIQAMASRGLISPQGSLNHKVVDYARFIRTGSVELARRAREIAETREGEEREFALAFAMGHEAMVAHARTYADECERLAAEADPIRADELREIARICRKVPAYPAETLHEALQSLWFAYMVAGDATGRIDVYLNDFYQGDLAAGRITPERAQELIECFMIKLHGEVAQGVVNLSSIQTLTLGGVLPDGSDATNDLTRLFLAAIRSVKLLRPTVYLRCHENTPDDAISYAVEMLGDGIAEPSFYGDKPIIEGLTRIGVPIEVARDYALSGCAEVVSPGLGNWGAPNGWINLALLVDEALREYASSGGSDTGDLWKAVERRIEDVAEVCRVCNVWVDEQRKDAGYVSTILMPVCLERCKDIVHGGAETHFGHWEAIGLPNATDMLSAAERLLQSGDSLSEAFDRLDSGEDSMRSRLRKMPRFGNDLDEADGIAARLVDLMADALERKSTPLRQKLVLGHLAGGENMHISYGLRMGPTLDGRVAGETLADSLAGSQGRTVKGPTAVVRSLCKLDHSKMIAGNVSTLRFSPRDFDTADSRRAVTELVKAYVALGGSQVQVNMVSAATLREAQAHPEDFAGLMIRVAGYSADFTQMGRLLQDEIIARTEACD